VKHHNKSFCILPWIQVSTTINGHARTCGLCKERGATLSKTPLTEAWNSDYFKQVRRKMLNDEMPSNCDTCYYLEQIGGDSKREIDTVHWERIFNVQDLLNQTNEDGSVNYMPHILDVRTGNTCNLKCIHCFTSNSSKWYEDKEMLDQYTNLQNVGMNELWKENLGNVWEFISEHGDNLHLISLIGGEPLAAKSHKKILQALLDRGAGGINLRYISNGTLVTKDFLNKLKEFKSVNFTVSLDVAGPKHNHFRFPSRWEKFRDNLQLLNDETADSNIHAQTQWTAHNIGIMYLDETFDYMKEFSNLQFNFGCYVEDPAHFHCATLPQDAKEEIKARLEAHPFSDDVRPFVDMYIGHMMSKDMWSEHKQTLRRYMDQLDTVRGVNWRSVYPELAYYVDRDTVAEVV
jgi:MoaA/NifB/PqqE/SkfB family radical SAM enzyme